MTRLLFIKKSNGEEIVIGKPLFFDSVGEAEMESNSHFEYGVGFHVDGEVADLARVEWEY